VGHPSLFEQEGEVTTVAILPESPASTSGGFRAVARNAQAVGKTAGEALDALAAQLPPSEVGTLLVVQHWRPDHFFTAEQQDRLRELMARWRVARDTQTPLPPEEQAELDALVEAELRAATARAAALAQELAP
jgi:hypothetical protein